MSICLPHILGNVQLVLNHKLQHTSYKLILDAASMLKRNLKSKKYLFFSFKFKQDFLQMSHLKVHQKVASFSYGRKTFLSSLKWSNFTDPNARPTFAQLVSILEDARPEQVQAIQSSGCFKPPHGVDGNLLDFEGDVCSSDLTFGLKRHCVFCSLMAVTKQLFLSTVLCTQLIF